MKKLYIFSMFVALITATSCSDKIQDEENDLKDLELREISAVLDNNDAIVATRAITITQSDPTATPISNRGNLGWLLNVTINKNTVAYGPGTGTYVWNTPTSNWIPQSGTIYFPNYSNQTGTFLLYASTPGAPVVTDQSTALALFNQDALAITTTVTPAHIVTVNLKHAQSMIDFTFKRLPHDVKSLWVEVGSTIYKPYQVPGTFQYLLILPAGTTTNPTIVITTTAGSVYRQVVKIVGNTSIGNPSSLAVNNRYIFSLIGFPLVLSPISVVDWISGAMLAGDYVAATAYPTFRGVPGVTCTLYFDNGLTQNLTFNSQGECTVKPLGRTIVKVGVGGVTCPASVILGDMIIDITPLINICII